MHIWNYVTFALSNNAAFLKECWRVEVLRTNTFSWRRLITRHKSRRHLYLLWWRLANEMYMKGNHAQRKTAKHINRQLKQKYTTDIALGAKIGINLHIAHHCGVVITDKAIIGENFVIRQNTTIGCTAENYDRGYLRIGDNVDVGANSCIIGEINIGSNVTFGAMSFVHRDVPADGVYITRKHSEFIEKTPLKLVKG